MSESPHAPTADAVIAELLWMSYMCVQVVTATPVMEETAARAVPMLTPSCTARSRLPHALKADTVVL